MAFLAPILAGAAGSLVSGLMGGGSSGAGNSQALLQEQEAQFNDNFALQTQQAMVDNNNATQTAIATSHAQTAAASTAAQREVGDANSHIVA